MREKVLISNSAKGSKFFKTSRFFNENEYYGFSEYSLIGNRIEDITAIHQGLNKDITAIHQGLNKTLLPYIRV